MARRAAQLREAQALTAQLTSARSWRDLERLFGEHKGQMNHIHMSALLTRLAHLAQQPPPAAAHAAKHAPPSQAAAAAVGWSKHEAPAVRLFLGQAVPFVGMHLLSLGPRQLANVMWAIGSLGYLPEQAWVAEWAACVARKLHAFSCRVSCVWDTRVGARGPPHAFSCRIN